MSNAYAPSDKNLTPQLVGLEGWRVEVVTASGATERFIVSRSLGPQPCHVKLKLRTSFHGDAADYAYASVLPLYPARKYPARKTS